MTNEVFYNIAKIIERDSKTTTYKFALLRGVIDSIQDNSPYIITHENSIEIPTGLLVEKWLLYYYPILQSQTPIPQISGETNLAFSKPFIRLIQNYESRGGFSAFYNDLKNKGIPTDLHSDFFDLAKKIRDTITKMPMKYIGRSISNDFYSIFTYTNKHVRKSSFVDSETLINDFGTFSIPRDYYDAFKVLGSFITGKDAILFKWAEFSANASSDSLSIESALTEILKSPITQRNILESKKLYADILESEGSVHCVWTGKKLKKYDIDHLIPFSVWRNNNLWNLLPSDARMNNLKRDKIPSPEIIEMRKNHILEYWEIMYAHQKSRFQKEIQIALLGNHSFDTWKSTGIIQLQNSCSYLIENRGFEEWKY